MFFTLDGAKVRAIASSGFEHSLIPGLIPMRDFARRLQQDHKPVATWLHTMGHHVGAESLHERTFMMLADFHPAVSLIAAQPFTFAWRESDKVRTHTPDIVLQGKSGRPLVVDVRNADGARDKKWLETVPAIEQAVTELGMEYMIWTGMSRPYRINLENFTEARVPADSYRRWAPLAAELCSAPMPASELANRVDETGYQRAWAMTLIRRMLWLRSLRTDMFSYFAASSIVEASGE